MPTTDRATAEAYAKENLASLAADVLLWRRQGAVPGNSLFHTLATQCAAYASDGDAYEYHEAERIVVQAALELAQAHQQIQWQVEHRHEPAPVTTTGYATLLPKLLALATSVDDMTDEEYGQWVNALQEDEFIAFISVSHTQESFLAAVAEAKRRLVDNEHGLSNP